MRIVHTRWRAPVIAVVVPAIMAAMACHDAALPTSPNVARADAAFSRGGDKAAVCHGAGQPENRKFTEVSVAGGAVSTHLNEHDGDYLVTPRTPCPPPATTAPNVRVCKVVDSEFLNGRFYAFDVNGESVWVRTAECVDRTFAVGTPVTIIENGTTGSQLHSIAITPPSAGAGDVAAATAKIIAGTDVAQVTFTNVPVSGDLTICKQLEPMGLGGRRFAFYLSIFGPTGTSHPGLYVLVTPPSVSGPPGTCVPAGSYPLGTQVRVFEEFGMGTFWFGVQTTAITVEPADRLVAGSMSLPGRRVTATIGEGTTQVRFVNARPLGHLQICTVSPTGFTGTTRFDIDAEWSDGSPPPVDVPANGCAPVPETGLGTPGVLPGAPIRIAELIPAGQRVTAITVLPADVPVEPGDPASGIVFLRPGLGTTTVTFQNVWASP